LPVIEAAHQWFHSIQKICHMLRKEDDDWVKKCMEYEVEGARPRSRPKKTWREIVEKRLSDT